MLKTRLLLSLSFAVGFAFTSVDSSADPVREAIFSSDVMGITLNSSLEEVDATLIRIGFSDCKKKSKPAGQIRNRILYSLWSRECFFQDSDNPMLYRRFVVHATNDVIHSIRFEDRMFYHFSVEEWDKKVEKLYVSLKDIALEKQLTYSDNPAIGAASGSMSTRQIKIVTSEECSLTPFANVEYNLTRSIISDVPTVGVHIKRNIQNACQWPVRVDSKK